jgi:TolB-like protein/DNA-binding winged helix-turn-helix (wHTH) protein
VASRTKHHVVRAVEGSDAPRLGRFRPATDAASTRANVLCFGSFHLDSVRRRLTSAGKEVPLKPRAFDMLELFVACRGQVLSADEIVGHVWRGVAVGDNNLGVQLSALRRALAAHGGEGLIVTLPGRGYRFVGEVTEPRDAAPPATIQHEVPAAAPEPPPPPRPTWPAWRAASIAGACLVAIAIAGTLVLPRPDTTKGDRRSNTVANSFNPPPYSVAVLAFANLSGDPGDDYLSDGFAEALIDVLSRANQLKVMARTASFYFKQKSATIGEIARTLNVGAVLEGSVRRQGRHIRIDAHLSDARTGYQIWSQSYDRNLDDMLKLQDEIAVKVADALQVNLVAASPDGRSVGGTNNPLAYDAYLRGEQHLRAVSQEEAPALAEFKKAIALDPDFALAQSGVAVASEWVNNTSESYDDAFRERMAQALRAATRAVELAPDLGVTHARLARCCGGMHRI